MQNQQGIVRFGNSELSFLAGRSIKHQNFDYKLASKLTEILVESRKSSREGNYILCLPLELTLKYSDINFEDWQDKPSEIKKIWRGIPRVILPLFLNKNKTYGSPFLFRIKDTRNDQENFLLIEKTHELFSTHDVIYVGPEDDKNKKYEDFLEPKKFIKIPSKNAFSNYDKILRDVKIFEKKFNNPLIVIVAGITGTVLSAELNNLGIFSIDFGQGFRHFRTTLD